jgi:hypothetical protein
MGVPGWEFAPRSIDRHRLWRDVSSLYAELEQEAPDGFEPVVEVFLVGREAPVEPAFVQTSRSEEYPWVLLQARAAADQSGKTREPDEYWVYVDENLIARVEVRFVPKGDRTIGFGVREVDESADAAAD